jgi:hypothetical protein
MSTQGNGIIVSSNPRGVFLEGAIKAAETPKPGTILQIDASAGLDANDRFIFEIYNRDADGNRPHGPLCILLTQDKRGVVETTAYAAGDACECYVPIAGEEFNLLIADISGTADDVAVGDIFIIDDGTGKLIANTGSPEQEPFMYLGTAITDPTADQLGHFIYSGS